MKERQNSAAILTEFLPTSLVDVSAATRAENSCELIGSD
jgi:hypothetical protein